MADPEPKPSTDSGTSDKTTVRTRGGKAAAVAAPAGRTRHGGRATPEQKSASSPRDAAGRASASEVAEAPDSVAAEQPRKVAKGKAKGKKATASPAADRASASAVEPEVTAAEDDRPSADANAEEADAKPSAEEAPHTAKAAADGDADAADPSSAYLRAQARTSLCWPLRKRQAAWSVHAKLHQGCA